MRFAPFFSSYSLEHVRFLITILDNQPKYIFLYAFRCICVVCVDVADTTLSFF